MHSVYLTLREVLLLKNEIYGLYNPSTQTLQKGLVNQNIPIKLKYWLNVLGERVNSEEKIIKKLYADLGSKYGETDEEGNITLNPTIELDGNTIVNPNYTEFQNEYSFLLEGTIQIENISFALSEIEQFTFEENYPIFNKFIVNDKEV